MNPVTRGMAIETISQGFITFDSNQVVYGHVLTSKMSLPKGVHGSNSVWVVLFYPSNVHAHLVHVYLNRTWYLAKLAAKVQIMMDRRISMEGVRFDGRRMFRFNYTPIQ